MFTKNHLSTMSLKKMGGVVALLASTLSFSTSAEAISFTTYTNQAAFTAAAGSLSTETFNSFGADASFDNGATVNLPNFSVTGFGSSGSQNVIDATPFNFSGSLNIDGTSYLDGFTNTTVGFTVTFNSPITAFGATFNGVSSLGITQLIAGGSTVGSIPFVNTGSTGFYGFVADTGFTTLTFNSANGNSDGFGADNFLYDAAVPFEFSPSGGLAVLGSLWLGRRWLKKAKRDSKI